MRGFEIERTLDEDTCSMETLPEKILKVPGIALVAAGTHACLIGLYDSAASHWIVYFFVKYLL